MPWEVYGKSELGHPEQVATRRKPKGFAPKGTYSTRSMGKTDGFENDNISRQHSIAVARQRGCNTGATRDTSRPAVEQAGECLVAVFPWKVEGRQTV